MGSNWAGYKVMEVTDLCALQNWLNILYVVEIDTRNKKGPLAQIFILHGLVTVINQSSATNVIHAI